LKERFLIKGSVQGVGFRPFIFRVANEMNLGGRVRNAGDGVDLEVSGKKENIESFRKIIEKKPPPACRVEKIVRLESNKQKIKGFFISESEGEAEPSLSLPPDIAVCDRCVKEMKDQENRRFLYPFTACVDCGPRFTTLEALPYDRGNTSMKKFSMCPECLEEYNNPDNRRYHFQANCCGKCGPNYTFEKKRGEDAIKKAVLLLKKGNAVAVKSWGGFHIMADAFSGEAVSKVRKIKKRKHKPLALMAKNIETVRKYCRVTEEDAEILSSFQRPILLLKKKAIEKEISSVSPDNSSIGMMLPYSGIHHLLFKFSGLDLFVTTSLNRPSEPTITDNAKAAGFFNGPVLSHELDISSVCDDSVLKSSESANQFIRRSRGYVAQPVEFPLEGSVLSSGAGENVSFCFTRDRKAYPSQYFGSLKSPASQERYMKNIGKWIKIWNHRPRALACDMHPGYPSRALFEKLSSQKGIPLYKIQHHHAHLAGCAAEHNLRGKLIGAAFDGVGYGDDGQLWGGEYMVFDYCGYDRMGRFKPHPLPGGDAAAREPFRSALSYAFTAGEKFNPKGVENSCTKAVRKMIKERINSPLSSSTGRFIDAAASICGLVNISTFSSRAPIALESLLHEMPSEGYRFRIARKSSFFEINSSDIIKGVLEDIKRNRAREEIASKVHFSIARAAADGLRELSLRTGIKKACLSGGVFLNGYLFSMVSKMLKEEGIETFLNSKVSPGDNGISYGQAAVCAAKYREEE